jgi:hypothetical protein
VTHFKTGHAVFPSPYDVNFSPHAEYTCPPQYGVIAIKPDNLTFAGTASNRKTSSAHYFLEFGT